MKGANSELQNHEIACITVVKEVELANVGNVFADQEGRNTVLLRAKLMSIMASSFLPLLWKGGDKTLLLFASASVSVRVHLHMALQ